MLSKKLKDIDFLKNTIMILKKENPSADLQLLEKTIGALYLLESLVNIATREIRYRNLKSIIYKEVLDDIKDFTDDIIYRKNKEHLEKIIIGIRKFKNFMLEKNFLIDKEVLTSASKVLYLISLIKNNKKIIEKYNKKFIQEIDLEIPNEYKKRLKTINKINKESYYYIIKSLE